MPRTSPSALQVLIARLKSDEQLAAHPELLSNLLTRTRGLQRRRLTEEEMDGAMVAVLLRRDILLAAGVATVEGMTLRVRQSEQVSKQGNALRRIRRNAVPILTRRPVPTAGRGYRVQEGEQADEDDEQGEPNNEAAEAAGGQGDGG